jgi:Family of unknown function (DUF5908)
MPIEIRELHIRVSVGPPAGGLPAGAPSPAPAAEGAGRQALIAECVEQVLQVLRDRKER